MANLAISIDTSQRETQRESDSDIDSIAVDQSGDLLLSSSLPSSAKFESEKQHTDVNENAIENQLVESDDNNNNRANDKESDVVESPTSTPLSSLMADTCAINEIKSDRESDPDSSSGSKKPSNSTDCCKEQQKHVTTNEQLADSNYLDGQINSVPIQQQQQQQQAYPLYANVASWYHPARSQQLQSTSTPVPTQYIRGASAYYTAASHPLTTFVGPHQVHPAAVFGTPICVGLDPNGAPIPVASAQQVPSDAWNLYQCTGLVNAQVHVPQYQPMNHSDLAVAAVYTAPWFQVQPSYQPQVPLVSEVLTTTSQIIPQGTSSSKLQQTQQRSGARECSVREETNSANGESCSKTEENDAIAGDNCCEELQRNPSTTATTTTITTSDASDTNCVDKPESCFSDTSGASDPIDCVAAEHGDNEDPSQDNRLQLTPAQTSDNGVVVIVDRLRDECNDRDETIDRCRRNENDDDDEGDEDAEEECDEDIDEEQSSVSIECFCESPNSLSNDEEKEEEPTVDESKASTLSSSTVSATKPICQQQSSALPLDSSLSSAPDGRYKSSMTTKANQSATSNDITEFCPNSKQQDQPSRLQRAIKSSQTSYPSGQNKVNYLNHITDLVPGSPQTTQPTTHQSQVIAQSNCNSDNINHHKSQPNLKPIVDTCQYGVQHLAAQHSFRTQQVYYNHISHYNQQVVYPSLVWQPSNTSTYIGSLPMTSNHTISSKLIQQPHLYYGYSYPYYALVQPLRQPNHLAQQAIYQSCAHRSQLYNPNPYQFSGMQFEPPILNPYNAHPPVWQATTPIVAPVSQAEYLRRLQHQPQVSYQSPDRLDSALKAFLPIDVEPAQVRQAYGMDKVWLDEFEALFSQFMSSNMLWTLVEVETNPSIRSDADIIGHKGRYILRINSVPRSYTMANDVTIHEQSDSTKISNSSNTLSDEVSDVDNDTPKDSQTPSSTEVRVNNVEACSSDTESNKDAVQEKDEKVIQDENLETEQVVDEVCDESDRVSADNYDTCSGQSDSDCDSGAIVANSTSTTSGGEESLSDDSRRKSENGDSQTKLLDQVDKTQQAPSLRTDKRHPRRFRMFIDSAKVRFCCDICGHGWTSMKGRVVFWYELFELVENDKSSGNLIGYCAYKLFGQQCDVCQVEGRFERPMWYPEEVTKALTNLYNKIGQVYFGFKMPAIDKQRRAGKPKTSHNSTLCQACHDGVCTDRK